MKYIINIMMCLLLLTGISSCNEHKQFDEELYKKVFAIVSSDAYNKFAKVHDLTEDESTGYISVSVGGTNPIDQNLRITLKHDNDLFDRYNRGTYDVETASYANLLPPAYYSIDSYEMTVPAGERSARLPIRIRPSGLSPDSIYLISLKISEYSNYEVNPEKADVLYHVHIKNYYAEQGEQRDGTNYNLKGKINDGNILGTKRMYPLTKNSARVLAGNQAFEADTAVINKWSIVLSVSETGDVVVSPFKENRIRITQLNDDPLYPNKFFIEDDGFRTFKTFLLHYQYKPEDSNTVYESKEELRLEFNEENEI
jgi:hypothetical protein